MFGGYLDVHGDARFGGNVNAAGYIHVHRDFWAGGNVTNIGLLSVDRDLHQPSGHTLFTFPDVGGVTIPYADPATGRVVPVRLTTKEATARRAHNETRWNDLVRDFRSLGIEPVGVTSHDFGGVLDSFLRWADLRQMWRGAPS